MIVTLTNGSEMLCDDFDYQNFILTVEKPVLHNNGAGYAYYVKQGKHLYFHRWLFNFPEKDIDHINGNPLDNRRQNLRLATRQQNMRNPNNKLQSNNTNGVRGVCFDVSRQRWKAYIKVNGTMINLGRFTTFDQAVDRRKRAEKQYNFL